MQRSKENHTLSAVWLIQLINSLAAISDRNAILSVSTFKLRRREQEEIIVLGFFVSSGARNICLLAKTEKKSFAMPAGE